MDWNDWRKWCVPRVVRMRRRQRRPIIIILNVFISRGVYRVSQIYIQCTLSYWKALTATAKFQSILFSSFAVVCRERTGSLPDKVYYIYILSLLFLQSLCIRICGGVSLVLCSSARTCFVIRERRVRRWSRGFFLLSLSRDRLPRRRRTVAFKKSRERERNQNTISSETTKDDDDDDKYIKDERKQEQNSLTSRSPRSVRSRTRSRRTIRLLFSSRSRSRRLGLRSPWFRLCSRKCRRSLLLTSPAFVPFFFFFFLSISVLCCAVVNCV